MMGSTENTAHQVQDCIQIDNAFGGANRDGSEPIEQYGHHHGHKQLEEVFDPQMNDPEAPMVDNREIGGAVVEKSGHVEDWNREPRQKEQHGELAMVGMAERRPHRAKEKHRPDYKAGGQSYLPRLAEIEIFPALVAEPFP